jgi:hypothetical protein
LADGLHSRQACLQAFIAQRTLAMQPGEPLAQLPRAVALRHEVVPGAESRGAPRCDSASMRSASSPWS